MLRNFVPTANIRRVYKGPRKDLGHPSQTQSSSSTFPTTHPAASAQKNWEENAGQRAQSEAGGGAMPQEQGWSRLMKRQLCVTDTQLLYGLGDVIFIGPSSTFSDFNFPS